MGKIGDQSLIRMQNKTLAHSATNGVSVHLFEVYEEKVYTYVGQVKLAGSPYSERQPGQDGIMRNVWVFPLTIVNGQIPAVPAITVSRQEAKAARQLKRLSDQQIEDRAKLGRERPGQRPALITRYDRDPHVAEHAKRRAKGICELCNQPAPFKNPDGDPYMETHHIIWLANGGPDTIENTAALCPNCHRKMHVLNLAEDRKRLRNHATSVTTAQKDVA